MQDQRGYIIIDLSRASQGPEGVWMGFYGTLLEAQSAAFDKRTHLPGYFTIVEVEEGKPVARADGPAWSYANGSWHSLRQREAW